MSETEETPVDGLTEQPDGDDTGDEPKGNREARYRVRAREAETERDTLAARLTELQTRELHRLAAEHLAAGSDIDLSGKPLADYLTPEGWVDHDAVKEAANALIASRPGLSKTPRATDRSQGLGAEIKSEPTWAAVFDR